MERPRQSAADGTDPDAAREEAGAADPAEHGLLLKHPRGSRGGEGGEGEQFEAEGPDRPGQPEEHSFEDPALVGGRGWPDAG